MSYGQASTTFTPFPWHYVRELAQKYQDAGVRYPGAFRVLRDLGYEILPGYRAELSRALCAPGRALVDHDANQGIFLYSLTPIDRELAGFHEVGHAILLRLRRIHGDRLYVPRVEHWCDLVARECLRRELARLE